MPPTMWIGPMSIWESSIVRNTAIISPAATVVTVAENCEGGAADRCLTGSALARRPCDARSSGRRPWVRPHSAGYFPSSVALRCAAAAEAAASVLPSAARASSTSARRSCQAAQVSGPAAVPGRVRCSAPSSLKVFVAFPSSCAGVSYPFRVAGGFGVRFGRTTEELRTQRQRGISPVRADPAGRSARLWNKQGAGPKPATGKGSPTPSPAAGPVMVERNGVGSAMRHARRADIRGGPG